MFILTDEKNKVLVMGNIVEYVESYPHFVEQNTIYQIDGAVVHEVETVPDGVEPEKYCYTVEQGFYLNPDWKEPTDPYQQGYDQAVLDMLGVE